MKGYARLIVERSPASLVDSALIDPMANILLDVPRAAEQTAYPSLHLISLDIRRHSISVFVTGILLDKQRLAGCHNFHLGGNQIYRHSIDLQPMNIYRELNRLGHWMNTIKLTTRTVNFSRETLIGCRNGNLECGRYEFR